MPEFSWLRRFIKLRSPVLTGLALFVLFFCALAWVQFATPDLPDNDGFYHIKMAALMRSQGLKLDFPWLPLTILNEHDFYDHHFLFHVALIPFTAGDLLLGAKWAAVAFAALALVSVWGVLEAQKLPYAWLWGLGMLSVSHAFLYRMSITRAQSLSLAFLMIGLGVLFSRRYTWLLPLGCLYVWLYNAFPLLLAMACLYAAAVWLLERRWEWRPAVYVTLGIALGLVLNPYFPKDLIFIYRHYWPKLTAPTALDVGTEWYPYTTLQLLSNSPLAWLGIVAGCLALAVQARRADVRTLSSLFLSVLFVGMTFQARRFVEYFPPFAVLFAAFASAPLVLQAGQHQRRWFGVLLAGLVAVGAWRMLPQTWNSVLESQHYDRYAGAAQWLAQHSAAGELVFQTDWDDFPRLFFYNTHNTYLAGLDPSYLHWQDPALYDAWVDISRGRTQMPSTSIRQRFHAHYAITDHTHAGFIENARKDPHLHIVYEDADAIVYQIAP